MPHNELAFFLKTRYICCLEWISRPFLFYALQAGPAIPSHPMLPADGATTGMASSVFFLAYKHLDEGVRLVDIVSRHHRHGGIWGLIRRSFGTALVLLAVAASAADKRQTAPSSGAVPGPLRAPDDWPASVRLAIATIRHWENNVTDLQWMRRTLEHLLETTLARFPYIEE